MELTRITVAPPPHVRPRTAPCIALRRRPAADEPVPAVLRAASAGHRGYTWPTTTHPASLPSPAPAVRQNQEPTTLDWPPQTHPGQDVGGCRRRAGPRPGR